MGAYADAHYQQTGYGLASEQWTGQGYDHWGATIGQNIGMPIMEALDPRSSLSNDHYPPLPYNQPRPHSASAPDIAAGQLSALHAASQLCTSGQGDPTTPLMPQRIHHVAPPTQPASLMEQTQASVTTGASSSSHATDVLAWAATNTARPHRQPSLVNAVASPNITDPLATQQPTPRPETPLSTTSTNTKSLRSQGSIPVIPVLELTPGNPQITKLPKTNKAGKVTGDKVKRSSRKAKSTKSRRETSSAPILDDHVMLSPGNVSQGDSVTSPAAIPPDPRRIPNGSQPPTDLIE